MRPDFDVPDLVDQWRKTAATLREYAAESQAVVLEQCADDLEVLLQTRDEVALTLREASDLSGYSTDHLGRLVRDGKVPNAGRPGAPRIARQHLPIIAGKLAGPRLIREIDRTQIVRSAINVGAG